MEEIRDLRVQKTYDALITAFCDLLNEKSFEEITVKKLCAHAKTKTATFYSHFSDKYDFFAFMAKELRSSFIADIESDPGRNAATYYTSLVSKGMDYLEQNKKLAISVKGSGILSGILQFMPDEIMDELRKNLFKNLESYEKLNHPDVLLQFMIGGMNQVTEWWFENRRNISKEDVSSDINKVISEMMGNESNQSV